MTIHEVMEISSYIRQRARRADMSSRSFFGSGISDEEYSRIQEESDREVAELWKKLHSQNPDRDLCPDCGCRNPLRGSCDCGQEA